MPEIIILEKVGFKFMHKKTAILSRAYAVK